MLGSENEVVKRLAGKVFGSPLVEEVLRGGCAHEVQNADLDMRPDLALLFLFAKDCRWDSTAQKLLKIAPAIEGSALRPFYNGGNLLDSGGKPKDFYFMYKTNVLNPFTFPDYYRYLNAYINNQMH